MLDHLFDIERLIHSFKTALACILGIVVIKLGHFQSGQWILISIVIVMCAQINVGGLVQKSVLRLAGTFAGCCLAIFALVVFGDSETIVLTTIAIAGFIFSYIATAKESFVNLGTLGAATTAIIMSTHNPTIILALDRLAEISIGILIAAVVSQFVLPIHARTHLLRAQTKTLKLLRDFYKACFASADLLHPVNFMESDEEVAKTITKQRQLSKEATREPLGMFFDRQHFSATLSSEKNILRSIDFMNHALSELHRFPANPALLSTIDYLNSTVPKALNTIIEVMDSEDTTNMVLEIPAMQTLKNILNKHINQYEREQAFYIDGFLFSVEILITSLTHLANLLRLPVIESSLKS